MKQNHFNGHKTAQGTSPSSPNPSIIPGTPPRKRYKSNNRQNGNGVSKKGGAAGTGVIDNYTNFKKKYNTFKETF
jgi:hypothetical protein